MKIHERSFLRLVGILGVVSLAGCASVGEPSGFLGNYGELREGPFFKQEYVSPKADFSRYRKVKVNPVDLGFLEQGGKLSTVDLDHLAFLFKLALETELAKRYEVLGPAAKPDAKTLLVSPALVRAKTPYRLLNVITTLVAAPLSSGSCSMEVKLADGGTGKVLAQAAEKRTGARDLASLIIGPFQRFGHAEAIFRVWSEKLAALIS